MSSRWILTTALLLMLPVQNQCVTTTCEIPSVEAGETATLTIHFGQDLSHGESKDFYLSHISNESKTRMLSCDFSYGDVKCDMTSCCTWERKVTDVFRVYIHNVSQEHEGMFGWVVIQDGTASQKYCNFSLKASTCPTDSINVANSHKTCNNQPLAIGHTCNVTCISNHYFQENQTSVTYTCVGENKWSPEMPAISCEAYTCPLDSIIAPNSHMICSSQPVTIGQICNVTCNHGHYFQENLTSMTYTCVWRNKWSPEIPLTSCKGQGKGLETHIYIIITLSIILCIVAIATIIILFKKRKWRVCKRKKEIEETKYGERSSRDMEENITALLPFGIKRADFERRMDTERGSRIQFLRYEISISEQE